jgi:UDP-N-acetylglucosamine 3-dehydrogenase
MSASTKIALVGLGRMGKNHMRVLRSTPGLELVAVVDPHVHPPVDLGPARFLCHASDLVAIDFDAAIVATPTATHYGIARALTRMGKDLLVEKPIAGTFADGEDLLERTEARGTRLVVGHVERFNPAVRRLREILRAGRLGTPLHFEFTRAGGCPETVRGNNVILDLAVHDMDVLRSLVGPVKLERTRGRVSWQAGIADTAEIFLEAGPGSLGGHPQTRGARASVRVNWTTQGKVRTIRVTGTEGVCLVDYVRQTCELVGESDDERSTGRSSWEDPLSSQARQFRDYLRTGEVGDLCTGKDALAAVLLAEHAIEAGRDRAVVRPVPTQVLPPVVADEWV